MVAWGAATEEGAGDHLPVQRHLDVGAPGVRLGQGAVDGVLADLDPGVGPGEPGRHRLVDPPAELGDPDVEGEPGSPGGDSWKLVHGRQLLRGVGRLDARRVGDPVAGACHRTVTEAADVLDDPLQGGRDQAVARWCR